MSLEKAPLDCFICDAQTPHHITLAGMKCLNCGLFMFDFDDYSDAYQILKKGRSRKQIADAIKLKPSTVSTYQGSKYGLYKLCCKLKEVN